ncbi:MAG: flagellar biosynthesis protein FlhA [Planctomycetota bacterium]|nr:flagellar biosynthesis protein FlhA [Planctomycetota bacterium]
MAAAKSSNAQDLFTRNLDLVLVIGIISLIIIIFVPPPTQIIDLLLVINITVSIAVLLTSLYVRQPLSFSAFPSLLLMTTAYRLALNVATTRLILTNAGDRGLDAAGNVIRTFGVFVAGDNPTIGFIIFAIIIIVQFVVITKGANRISEVAARFTLDAMPGKQMSIDADLNAGLIKENEARERRQSIAREADFYGAMDGATKFVRGDAIAGIIITLVNIIGGFIVGMLQFDMTVSQSAETFTKLTIGDGLVSQIPSLLVSLAAGLIVTRTTAASNLGTDMLTQVFSSPRALTVTAGFLILLGMTPLLGPELVGVAGIVGTIAYLLQKGKKETAVMDAARKEKETARKPERVEGLLHVDPMELEIGYGLIPLADPSQGGNLMERIALLRRQIAVDMGFILPPVRIRDNAQLESNQYVFKIRGTTVAAGTALADQFLAMDSGAASGKVEGVPTTEPVFGLPAWWIPAPTKERAEALGYAVVDSTTVLTTHLTEIIKNNAGQLLTREDVNGLINTLKESSPSVVGEVIPNLLKIGEVQKILQNLLREGVSIRDLGTVLETLGDYAPRTKDLEVLTEYVRYALARSICAAYQDKAGAVYVATLDPKLEDTIKNSIERTDAGSFLTLSPKTQKAIIERMKAVFADLARAGHPPAILASPQIRWHVKRIADTIQSGVAVLSHNEVARVKELRIEAVETISVE